jgi:hypothetical protein
VEKVRACPATLEPTGAGRDAAAGAPLAVAPELAGPVLALASAELAGGVLTQPAANTAAAAAAQRRAEEMKIGDCVYMKASLSGKTAPSGQCSTDDYFSTILKFATP